jgi:hypothetical protein
VGPEATGEDLAVVGEDLIGDAVAQHRRLEDLAHGSRGGACHEACGDAEAAVIVDAGDDLEVAAIVQQDAAHDVHLPQLHGPVPLEATKFITPLLAPAQLDEVVTLEAAIDARATRQRIDTLATEFVQDAARPPAGMLATQLADQGLELRRDLVRAAVGAVRPIGESGETARLVAGDPLVHRLARHAEPSGDLGDLPAVLDHSHDRLIALLHDAQLHEVHRRPPAPRDRSLRRPRGVNDQPEPPSTISRNTCKRSAGPA